MSNRIEIEKFTQSHSAKTIERGDPLGFFNIHSVANYQQIQGGPFGDISKKNRKKVTQSRKRGKSHSVQKSKGVPSAFLFHLRGFGCVQNEVLSTYVKSA